MKNWKDVLISPSTPILEAMRIIDSGALQVSLVIDSGGRLIGVVTDGDIRRGILKGITLEENVEKIMNRSFTYAGIGESQEQILATMVKKQLRHMPILDNQGKITNVKLLDNLVGLGERKNIVVIMAGGQGNRLRPLTDCCPKPLLKVGGKPLLENLIQSLSGYGFRKIYISVNYMAEMIEDYFGNGSKFGVSISYLREDSQLGTAGAIGLFEEYPVDSFFVINGDLLTQINFNHLLDFHLHQEAVATLCVKEYHYQVPFGVVQVVGEKLAALDEKPVQSFFVNAGIYVLEPSTLALIPKKQYFDMTMLFNLILHNGLKSSVFPVREYWMDIGRMEDYEQAHIDYHENFK